MVQRRMVTTFPVAVLFLNAVVSATPNQGFLANFSRRLSVTAGSELFTGSLTDTGCYAPKADGGWGFCGPSSCKAAYITCPADGGGPATVGGVTGTYTNNGGTQYSASNCKPFLARTATADKTDWSPPGPCDSSCTQVTTGVCSGTFLANVLVGTGVKYAYCSDKWLIISSSGEPSVFTPNLNDVPFPPSASGTNYVTGMDTLDTTRAESLFFPLSVTDLGTSAGTNNIGVYDTTTGSGPQSYLIDGSDSYGVPADGGTGMGVNGQPIFPIYNNNAQYTPQKCEVDSCGNHVGQGGGQPHFHGDPFSDQSAYKCLYGPSNYSSTTGHPPVIGFAFDGHLIYGRYLSTSAPGFAAPLLDDCGGHVHTAAGTDEHGFSLQIYHYHTQVFDATCPSNGMCTSGETYKASTTGPFKCFKADLSASEGSSALILATTSSTYKTKNEMENRCCGMTDYYVLNGVDISSSVASSSTCSAPAAPANGVYAAASTCATAGTTLYSGNQCTPTCSSGYCASGTTRCVKGVLTEAICEACGATNATTTMAAPTPAQPTPTPPTPTPPTPQPAQNGNGTTTVPPTPTPATAVPTPMPTAAPSIVAVNVSVQVLNFANFDLANFLAAVVNSSGSSNNTATASSMEYLIETTLSFTDTVTAAQAKPAVASSNNVPEPQVTITTARRLEDESRRLVTNFAVTITTTDLSTAQAVSTSANDVTALTSALESQGINTTASATTPVNKVAVVTEVSIAASNTGSSVTSVQNGLVANLAARVDSAIVGATTTPVTTSMVTIVSTPAPTPVPPTPTPPTPTNSTPSPPTNSTPSPPTPPTPPTPPAGGSASLAKSCQVAHVFLIVPAFAMAFQ